MMWTPLTDKRVKRVHTTASTDNPISNSTMIQLQQEKQQLSFVYPQLQDLKKQLFESRRENTQMNASRTVQQKYRKKMISYLNQKFEGKGKKIEEPKKVSRVNRSRLTVEQTVFEPSYNKALFKQYMKIVREHTIKGMREYEVGTILQKLGFIRKLIDERQLVRKICQFMKQPSLMELFVFISFIYFHPKQKRNPIIAKQQLCLSIQQLFMEQGYPFSIAFISKIYDIYASSTALDSSIITALLNNRLGRQTHASRSREGNRRRL